MDNENGIKIGSSGIGLSSIVFVVFLILKLAKIGDVANWSWRWVTAPLWLPLGIGIAIFAIFGLIMLLIAFFNR